MRPLNFVQSGIILLQLFKKMYPSDHNRLRPRMSEWMCMCMYVCSFRFRGVSSNTVRYRRIKCSLQGQVFGEDQLQVMGRMPAEARQQTTGGCTVRSWHQGGIAGSNRTSKMAESTAVGILGASRIGRTRRNPAGGDRQRILLVTACCGLNCVSTPQIHILKA